MIQRRDIRAIRCLDLAVFQLDDPTDEEIVTIETLGSTITIGDLELINGG
jgi:hypothetical protein